MAARTLVVLSVLHLALVLAGCPDSSAKLPAAACETAYEKCTQANGVLGVCDVVECPADREPPCLTCRSQH